jgi:hypothetical protein
MCSLRVNRRLVFAVVAKDLNVDNGAPVYVFRNGDRSSTVFHDDNVL